MRESRKSLDFFWEVSVEFVRRVVVAAGTKVVADNQDIEPVAHIEGHLVAAAAAIVLFLLFARG